MVVTGPLDVLFSALSRQATRFFFLQVSELPRKILLPQSIVREQRSPENGDKDHADVRGCANAPHAGNEVLLPLFDIKKKCQTRETVVAAAQRWRRDPGGRGREVG